MPGTSQQKGSLYDFGPVAFRYEEWYGTPIGRSYDTEQKELVGRFLPPAQAGARLLDIGCGTGHWSRFFASLGYAVVGIDVSPEMIRIAQTHPAPRCSYYLGDACDLPFDDDSFDVVAAIAALAFIADAPAALRQMFRCLRPAGTMIVGALNRLARLPKESNLTLPGACSHPVDSETCSHLTGMCPWRRPGRGTEQIDARRMHFRDRNTGG